MSFYSHIYHYFPNLIQYNESPTEAEQVQAVLSDPFTIRYIKDGSYRAQRIAIEYSARLIRYIDSPHYKACKKALKMNGKCLKWVEPIYLSTEEYTTLCTIAINQSPYAVKFVEFDFIPENIQIQIAKKVIKAVPALYNWCPRHDDIDDFALEVNGLILGQVIQTPDRIKKAIMQNPFAIQFVNDPTEVEQICAIFKNPYVIGCIKESSFDAQMFAVKININTIKLIGRPYSSVVEYVLKKNPKFIQFTPTATNKMLMNLIKADGLIVKYMILGGFILEEHELEAAVRSNPLAIQYYSNAPYDLKVYAIKKNPRSCQFMKDFDVKLALIAIKSICVELNKISSSNKTDIILFILFKKIIESRYSEHTFMTFFEENPELLAWTKFFDVSIPLEIMDTIITIDASNIRYIANPPRIMIEKALKIGGPVIMQYVSNISEALLSNLNHDDLEYYDLPEDIQRLMIEDSIDNIEYIINPTFEVAKFILEETLLDLYLKKLIEE